jgi:hypothetical protein
MTGLGVLVGTAGVYDSEGEHRAQKVEGRELGLTRQLGRAYRLAEARLRER